MSNYIIDIVGRYRASGIEQQIDYQKFYLYSIITHSTAIEGSTLTEIENQLAVYQKDTGRDRININHDRIKAARDRINDRITEGNHQALIALCEYVFVNPTSTAKEIASHLGVSEPTVNRYIRSLRDLGVITRNGARKNGHWILNPQ